MQSSTKPFPADGSPLEADAGHHRIRLIPTIDGGVTMQILTGTHEEWAEQFGNEREARTVAHQLTASLRRAAENREGGAALDQLIQDRKTGGGMVADVERFLKAKAAAQDAADAAIQTEYDEVDGDAIAARLRTDQDTWQAADDTAHNATVATVQAGRNTDGWNEARRAARTAAAWATVDAVSAVSRPVRVTRTQIFRKSLNAVQKRAARLQRDGVVYCGPGTGVSPQTLRSMHDRIGGELLMHPAVKHRLVGLRLPVELRDPAGQAAA
ncbi:hypothetical protein [Actinoplanes sp. NPDC051494]|uniref:hypothetical protein n=1 Tax=Actinoplanes sp. NPDC051494 TaxID=3363907 RepID=UPI0037B88F6A